MSADRITRYKAEQDIKPQSYEQLKSHGTLCDSLFFLPDHQLVKKLLVFPINRSKHRTKHKRHGPKAHSCHSAESLLS